VSLSQLQVDVYPYHLASADRAAWVRYSESVHATWLNNSVNSFKETLLSALCGAGITPPTGKPHSPLARAGQQGKKEAATAAIAAANGDLKGTTSTKEAILSQFGKLLTANLIVRLANFTVWKVSTSKEKTDAKEFIMGKLAYAESFSFALHFSTKRARLKKRLSNVYSHAGYTVIFPPSQAPIGLRCGQRLARPNRKVPFSLDRTHAFLVTSFSLSIHSWP